MENTISACMIVRDEEKYLDECLNSIKNLVDEIIIIDTGSKDRTKEIAKRFTNKVFDFKWNNDFSEARNLAISYATKNWILSIDADESISKNDHYKIRKTLDQNPDADAFFLNCRTYTNEIGIMDWKSSKDDVYIESKKASGYYTAKLLRIFRNKKDFFFEGKIHETPHNSIKIAGGICYDMDVVLHHFGDLNEVRLLNKKETYIDSLKERIEKKDFSEKGENHVYFEMARELIKLKKTEEAIYYLEKATEIKEKFEYLSALGTLYMEKEELDNAEKILKRANEINPGNSSLNSNLGVIYAKRKEFNKAIRRFEKAIELNPDSADAYFNLALVYRDKNKLNKMKVYLDKAIELNPTYKKKAD